MTAYAKTYLMDAMENLGEMADCATTLLGLPLEQFWPLFAASDTAGKIAAGSPFVIEGKSGAELALDVCDQTGISLSDDIYSRMERALINPEIPEAQYRLSQEYWCGWILGFYQWFTDRPFSEIERLLPITTVCAMYPTFHEESEERFCEAAQEMIAASAQTCGLKRQRLIVGLSQSQLAHRSGVGIRAIQQYEQGAKELHKASFDRVEKLSKALHCAPELLLDVSAEQYDYAAVMLP